MGAGARFCRKPPKPTSAGSGLMAAAQAAYPVTHFIGRGVGAAGSAAVNGLMRFGAGFCDGAVRGFGHDPNTLQPRNRPRPAPRPDIRTLNNMQQGAPQKRVQVVQPTVADMAAGLRRRAASAAAGAAAASVELRSVQAALGPEPGAAAQAAEAAFEQRQRLRACRELEPSFNELRREALQQEPEGARTNHACAATLLGKRSESGTRRMEVVSNAVNDELMQSLDYKLRTSNVSYVTSRKDVMCFPSSLSTFTPTTSRVARIPLTSGADFIDPESVKIAFRVRNNDGADGLFPDTLEPSCFIKRAQLFALRTQHEESHAMRGIVHTHFCMRPIGMAVLCTHKSLRCEHLLEGETNSRSPGASASREQSINKVKQARTTLYSLRKGNHRYCCTHRNVSGTTQKRA